MKSGILITLLLAAGCSRSNNLLLGRVEANLGSNPVVVTDCYRTSVPAPEQLPNHDFHYMPCRDADIWIRSQELMVNGTNFGHVGPGDEVVVDHGVVSVHRQSAAIRPR